METRFLLEGYKRKDLAKALAGILETEVNYLGMPSMSYRIGNSFLEKDGTFIWRKLLKRGCGKDCKRT